MIDRESPIPIYFQIKQDLLDRISMGEWDINDMLPSEAELTLNYKVSRVTVRQALAELEKDGLIKKFRGKGAQIIDNSPRPFIHELNYRLVNSEETTAISAKILKLIKVKPYPEVVKNLQLKEGEDALFLKRVFFLNNQPIAIGKSWLPEKLMPDLIEKGLIKNSLSTTLEKRYQIIPTKVNDNIEAVRATQSESKALNCTLDVPLLLISGISSLPDGTPVEFSQTHWLGDGVRFRIHLEKTPSGYI